MDSPIASKKENNELLSLENVWKIYKMGEVEVPALRGVSVEIKNGDFVVIITVKISMRGYMNEELTYIKTKNLKNCPNRNRYYLANAVAGAASFFIPNHHLTAAFG